MSKKLGLQLCAAMMGLVGLPVACWGQVNSGSDGSDGAFNPTTNTVVDMAEHPNGVYQYTSVNVPTNVTVSFIPNANNAPVTWLVQSSCVISGTVDVSGKPGSGIEPGAGGPGGGGGGYGGRGSAQLPHRGAGLGGGDAAGSRGGNASYATAGDTGNGYNAAVGLPYGNKYVLPLVGGSGGGGAASRDYGTGGGGGGGAVFIVSNTRICVGGIVSSYGGNGGYDYQWSLFAGGGSGGAVRLLAPQITGKGAVVAYRGCGNYCAGDGYVRLDVLDDQFFGTLVGSASRGFNPILVAPPQSATLAIQSVAGNAVPPNPTGVLVTPDVAIAGQQGTPIAVVVRCANISLGTPITVVVKGVNGPMVLGTGYNNAGTLASSTATVQVSVPRGGGTIYATVATGH